MLHVSATLTFISTCTVYAVVKFSVRLAERRSDVYEIIYDIVCILLLVDVYV